MKTYLHFYQICSTRPYRHTIEYTFKLWCKLWWAYLVGSSQNCQNSSSSFPRLPLPLLLLCTGRRSKCPYNWLAVEKMSSLQTLSNIFFSISLSFSHFSHVFCLQYFRASSPTDSRSHPTHASVHDWWSRPLATFSVHWDSVGGLCVYMSVSVCELVTLFSRLLH